MIKVSFWKETPRGRKKVNPETLHYLLSVVPRIGETFILGDADKNNGEYETFTVTRVIHFPDEGTVRVVGRPWSLNEEA